MNKERFEEMELELIAFGASDVIATSDGGTGGGYENTDENW